MVCVEGGILLEGALTRTDAYIDIKKLGRVGVSVCTERGWSWLSNLIWPGTLLCIQTSLSPFIWKSRRNYKEGVLFSLASLGCCLVTGAWVAVYLLCSGDLPIYSYAYFITILWPLKSYSLHSYGKLIFRKT